MNYRTIALICYANAYLRGRTGERFPTGAWLRDSDGFVFRNVVKDAAGKSTWNEITTDPDVWFAFLAGAGVRGLKLLDTRNADDWQHVWKLNGVDTAIEAIRSDGDSELWSAVDGSWSADADEDAVSDPEKPAPESYWDRLIGPLVDIDKLPPAGEHFATATLRHILSVPFLPITLVAMVRWCLRPRAAKRSRASAPASGWRFFYSHIGHVRPASAPGSDLAKAKRELIACIGEARRLAQEHGKSPLLECVERFDKALGMLNGQSGPADDLTRVRRLAPAGILTPEAEAMLMAAAQAWVFGAMMSWNDVAFDGPDRSAIEARYNAVSERLYAGLMQAIHAAANSSCPRL